MLEEKNGIKKELKWVFCSADDESPPHIAISHKPKSIPSMPWDRAQSPWNLQSPIIKRNNFLIIIISNTFWLACVPMYPSDRVALWSSNHVVARRLED